MMGFRSIVSSLQVWTLLVLATTTTSVQADNLRKKERRQLNSYHTLTNATLGFPNPDAASGNPLKGLVENPVYTNPPYKSKVPLSVEFYYLEFDKIMLGNPKVVGEDKAFDWKYLDDTLTGSASRNMHAAWRVFLEFPYHYSGNNFHVPQYLLDAGLKVNTNDGQKSPSYADPILLEALEQFITSSGKRYNGDKRLGFIQCGLLGHWGEWHGPDLPESSKEKLIGWYAAAYTKTQVQVRYPSASAYAAGFGIHDDSFTYSTLDGASDGGVNGGGVQNHYTWRSLINLKQTDYWKRGSMGGEARNQGEVFKSDYRARTWSKQDYMECVNVTHTSWMFHHGAFREGGYTGTELTNALFAHARMGYNFHVPSVSVKPSSTSGQVDVDVTVTQIGVAPYYYDLGLAIKCPDMTKKVLSGVNTIVNQGESKVFGFTGLPATSSCLSTLSLALESSYAYAGRPIKFAQGSGTVAFSLPLPGSVPAPTPIVGGAPVSVPVSSPASAPVVPPASSPMTASVPVSSPNGSPASGPVSAPKAISAPGAPPVSSPSEAGQSETRPQRLRGWLKRLFKRLLPG